jgi:DNA mismatch repair protein MutS
VDESRDLELREARHPMVEALGATAFVPNDLVLSGGRRELALITGPNMAGKSTFIRQNALLVVLAQMGSFVPAESARIGLVDRVFTRIGASDELSRGNSTFMVEMLETAAILNSATERSLVILDEVGRGTSTFDGLAIAWAITEHLATHLHARTLFATHYHQLIDVADKLPNACNLNVAVREWGDEIVFLHRIVEGGSDRSWGIHVAGLAGVPVEVITRAKALLAELEIEDAAPATCSTAPAQLTLFEPPADEVRKALAALDPERMTPLAALQELARLKGLLET